MVAPPGARGGGALADRLLPLAALLAAPAARAELLEVDQPNTRPLQQLPWSSPVGRELRPSRGALRWAKLMTSPCAEGGAEVRRREAPPGRTGLGDAGAPPGRGGTAR